MADKRMDAALRRLALAEVEKIEAEERRKADEAQAAKRKAERDAALHGEYAELSGRLDPARLEPWRERVVEAAVALARELSAARATDIEAARVAERMVAIEGELGLPRGETHVPNVRAQSLGARREAARAFIVAASAAELAGGDVARLYALLME